MGTGATILHLFASITEGQNTSQMALFTKLSESPGFGSHESPLLCRPSSGQGTQLQRHYLTQQFSYILITHLKQFLLRTILKLSNLSMPYISCQSLTNKILQDSAAFDLYPQNLKINKIKHLGCPQCIFPTTMREIIVVFLCFSICIGKRKKEGKWGNKRMKIGN